uniref:Uncharacterized protein n=1 Tax=Arundo donax TaxID=35708 RepID=A0A0A9BJJ8_ARUDO
MPHSAANLLGIQTVGAISIDDVVLALDDDGNRGRAADEAVRARATFTSSIDGVAVAAEEDGNRGSKTAANTGGRRGTPRAVELHLLNR